MLYWIGKSVAPAYGAWMSSTLPTGHPSIRPHRVCCNQACGRWHTSRWPTREFKLCLARVPAAKSGGVVPLIRSDDPAHLHVKDPVFAPSPVSSLEAAVEGRLICCVHSFAWSEGHSGDVSVLFSADGAVQLLGPFHAPTAPLGLTWDVAAARITGWVATADCLRVLPAPSSVGEAMEASLVLLYDGAETFRPQPGNERSKHRPRGYCCEELGGALIGNVHHNLDAALHLRRLDACLWKPLLVGALRCEQFKQVMGHAILMHALCDYSVGCCLYRCHRTGPTAHGTILSVSSRGSASSASGSSASLVARMRWWCISCRLRLTA